MAITSAAIVPLSQILIRNYLGDKIGWAAAGYWEAMWRLSGAYLMFVTTTLGVYYLPRLSELNDVGEIKKEVLNGYKIILPAVGLASFFVYLSRSYLINILFSAEFQPMSQLFFWQLIGDILKISGWLLAYVMLSKAMTLAYILSEVVFSLGFYVLVVLLVDLYGIEGAAMAHALNYLIYTFVLAIYIFGSKGKI
jgi:PST family polysaccharide transporter